MNNTIKFFVSKNISGERLDIFLSKNIKDLTRSYIKKLIQQKGVRINDIVTNLPSKKLRYNDKISVKIINKIESKLKPKKISLDITDPHNKNYVM